MVRATSRPHYNMVFAVLLLGIAAFSLLQSLVVPVLPVLISSLHTTQGTATWLMTGYLLSASVATPILGRLGDKVGKERVLVFTLCALTAGSLIAALTTSVGVMIAARVLQGIGGGVLPLAFGIIRDEFPPAKLHAAVGIASALVAVGGGFGLALAGPVVENLGYHWLFWIPMIMTSIATVAAIRFVPKSPVRNPDPINWGAALLLSTWLTALLLAVSKGPQWEWTSARVLGLFTTAVVAFALWVAVELRSSTPLIDMRTMRIPAVWTTNLVALTAGAAMFATMTFLPQLIQTPRTGAGYGLSATVTQSGLYILPMALTMFLLGTAAAPIAMRLGTKVVVGLGSAVMVPPFIMLALAHDKIWQIAVAVAVLGAGLGLVFSSMSSIVVAAVPPAQTGAATGINANIRTVGGAIGSAICGSILTSGTPVAQRFPAESGYTGIFWFLTAVSVLAVLASVLIPTIRAHSGVPPTPAAAPIPVHSPVK